MKLKRVVFSFLFFVAACAATGPLSYGPADSQGFGYTQSQIEKDRFRVVYRGSAGMPIAMVEDFALRRAAELTLQEGYAWFGVVSKYVDEERRGGVDVGTGFGTGSYGRGGGVSVGVGTSLGRVGEKRYHTVRLEIYMGNGERDVDASTYDAASVFESLRDF